MIHALVLKINGKISGDVRRAIVAEQPRFLNDRGVVAARHLQRQFQRAGDVHSLHRRAELRGQGRIAASEQLGLDQVPVIRIVGLGEAQKRGLTLADNRIAENAGWDSELLARELADLSSLELDFDLEVTGFDMAEIDLAIEGLGDFGGQEGTEVVPEPEAAMSAPKSPS